MTRLATARLALHPAGADDAPALVRLWAEPEIRRFLFDGRAPSPEAVRGMLEASLRSFAERGYGLWLFAAPGQDAPEPGAIDGFAGLLARESTDPSLIYGLRPGCTGRGLATEAARGVLDHAFGALGLARVHADVDEPNAASIRVLERLGMRHTGRRVKDGRPLLDFELRSDAGGRPASAPHAAGDPVRIVPARPADAAVLPSIELAAAELFPEEDLPAAARRESNDRETFERAAAEGRLLVALGPDDRPVGFALLDELDGCGHLEELDVHPDHGRRGIGRALVEASAQWARARGLAALTLSTFRHLAWNAPFYARCGFRELSAAERTPGIEARLRAEVEAGLDPARRIAMRRPLAAPRAIRKAGEGA